MTATVGKRASLSALALATAIGLSCPAHASEVLGVVVVRENSVGSSHQAQPHLDRLLGLLAKKGGWGSAKGRYLTRRQRAVQYIQKERPQFGILSLGAFLALKREHGLKVIGQVSLTTAGGRQYFVVSKTAATLDACKGQTLASNHVQDPKFIESVVASGAFRMADFSVLSTRRPVQTLKKVIRDEAACALVDDAQLSTAAKVEGGAALKVVWKSRELPPMPVVAFGGAPATQIARFQKSITSLCTAEGRAACKNVGIISVNRASNAAYAKLLEAYFR